MTGVDRPYHNRTLGVNQDGRIPLPNRGSHALPSSRNFDVGIKTSDLGLRLGRLFQVPRLRLSSKGLWSTLVVEDSYPQSGR